MLSTTSSAMMPGSFTDTATSPDDTRAKAAGSTETYVSPAALAKRPQLDHPVGHLSVTLVSARNLPKMDLLSETDAFAKLSIDLPLADAERLYLARAEAKRAAERAGNTMTETATLGAEVHYARTATVSDSRSPVWHEQFDFAIHSLGGPIKLYLEVFDEDSVTSHDLIGRGAIDLRALFAAAEGRDGPLRVDELPDAPVTAPGVPEGFKEGHEDGDDDVTGHYVSVAEAGLTGGIKAARTVWVPLVSEQGESAGEVLVLVYYEPKTRLDRAKARVSAKVNAVKDKLTATVVTWITDWTAGQVKSSFK